MNQKNFIFIWVYFVFCVLLLIIKDFSGMIKCVISFFLVLYKRNRIKKYEKQIEFSKSAGLDFEIVQKSASNLNIDHSIYNIFHKFWCFVFIKVSKTRQLLFLNDYSSLIFHFSCKIKDSLQQKELADQVLRNLNRKVQTTQKRIDENILVICIIPRFGQYM